jgi:hypothetical protein
LRKTHNPQKNLIARNSSILAGKHAPTEFSRKYFLPDELKFDTTTVIAIIEAVQQKAEKLIANNFNHAKRTIVNK